MRTFTCAPASSGQTEGSACTGAKKACVGCVVSVVIFMTPTCQTAFVRFIHVRSRERVLQEPESSAQDVWVSAAGTAFSRWTTEATVMQEFKQYGHYMQPRIHKMIQEVRAS